MAITLSAKAQLLLSKRNVETQLIMEIDGIDTIFGSIDVLEIANYGDPGLTYGQPGVVYGGSYVSQNSKPYISLSGSSNTISQQLNQDKGSAQSVASMNIELIDFNGEVTEIISPSIILPDILGVKSRVYLNFAGGSHPEDSILIHRGIISDVETSPASVKLTVANPEKQKQQKIFIKQSTDVTSLVLYNSKVIAGIYFKRRSDITQNVSITIVDTGTTAGAEIVTVVGAAITIDIDNGVSTASQIKKKLIESAAAMELVSVRVENDVAQNIAALQFLTTDTTVNVTSTDGFLLPDGTGKLRTYIKVSDEIIEYTGLTATSFTGCTRAQLDTIGSDHNIEANVDSFYRIQGSCIDIALWIMLSNATSPYQDNLEVSSFNKVTPTENIVGAVMFSEYDIQEKLGLVIGDKITTIGAINGSNNLSAVEIIDFGQNDYGSYILTGSTTVYEDASTALAGVISKYNVLPEGLGMTPDDVDVFQHELIKTRYVSSLPDLDIYIKDTVDAKDWLTSEIYFPSGLYTLPRKARASCSIVVPPVADQQIFKLDDTTLTEASKIKPLRSISKAFYNSVVFKYEQDSLEDKFLRAKVNYSADSQNRIKNVGNRVLTVTSAGLRDTAETDTLIRTNSRRLLERYQFAAEIIPNLKPLYKEALAIEVGDVVIFGSEELKISDISRGDRNFTPKLYEVSNKELNFKTGSIVISLLSTNFSLDGRYGIISPNSYIGVGSTNTDIIITNSFNTQPTEKEKNKWTPYIGQTIRVRNTTFSIDEETTLVGFDPANDNKMIVSPALSFTPTAGMLIDSPAYPDSTDPEINSLWKLLHCYFDPQVLVVSGASNTVFDVGAGDIGKFTVGSIIRIHNMDFTIDSVERTVSNINVNQITVNDSLGFTPAAGQFIELIGFKDGGLPYRIL